MSVFIIASIGQATPARYTSGVGGFVMDGEVMCLRCKLVAKETVRYRDMRRRRRSIRSTFLLDDEGKTYGSQLERVARA